MSGQTVGYTSWRDPASADRIHLMELANRDRGQHVYVGPAPTHRPKIVEALVLMCTSVSHCRALFPWIYILYFFLAHKSIRQQQSGY